MTQSVTTETPALVADLGGTNIRFALVNPSDKSLMGPVSVPCDQFADVRSAIEHYLDGRVIAQAALAVAAPVDGDEVSLTNGAWSFKVSALKEGLGLDRLVVMNDFAAIAHAVPVLTPQDWLALGPGHEQPDAPIGLIGPGTGLGVSVLVPIGAGRYQVLETEGGHVTMPATTGEEAELLDHLRRQMGHVSAEKVISGPGLVNIYRALAQMSGRNVEPLNSEKIVQAALAKASPLCGHALELFFAMLGTVSGNLALTVGAKGGIVLAGGILPHVKEALLASRFRQQFEAKGRFHPWLSSVSTKLIVHPYPALMGLAHGGV